MLLEYAGPKPLISHTGIAFDLNKSDKYRYLPFVAELLMALNHNHEEACTFTYEPDRRRYSESEIMEIIRRFAPEAEAQAQIQAEKKRRLLDKELADARRNTLLTVEERHALAANLELMRDYRIRRAVNKSLYYSAVRALASLIAHGRVSYIETVFSPVYFHVLHTLEGVFTGMKGMPFVTLSVFEKEGRLFVRLKTA